MAEYLVTDTELTAVANAIRAKTGSTDTMTLAEMPGKIESIETGGGGGDTDAMINGSLTEVTSNVGTVGDYAFGGCPNLESATLPLATTIGEYAFAYCSNLENINIPLVTSIGGYAFDSCSALTDINLSIVTSIGENAFELCPALTSINAPVATSVGIYAFNGCSALVSVDLPVATTFGNGIFRDCSALTSVNLPAATNLGFETFSGCSALVSIDLPQLQVIDKITFANCSALTALILRRDDNNSVPCALHDANSFNNTPIASGTGYIYVPSALLDTYKAATNWTTYADQFRALESYTVDGTTTGALDESKI